MKQNFIDESICKAWKSKSRDIKSSTKVFCEDQSHSKTVVDPHTPNFYPTHRIKAENKTCTSSSSTTAAAALSTTTAATTVPQIINENVSHSSDHKNQPSKIEGESSDRNSDISKKVQK